MRPSGSLSIRMITAAVPTSKRSASPGLSAAASRWATSMITRLSASARSTASTLLSRPTESGRMMYGKTTVSLSGRTGRTSGILMASSCGLSWRSTTHSAVFLSLQNMQYPSLLPLVLDLRELQDQQAVLQPGRPLVGVDRRQDVDLAGEPAVPALQAVEADLSGLGQGGRLGAGDHHPRSAHLDLEVGGGEAGELGEDLDHRRASRRRRSAAAIRRAAGRSRRSACASWNRRSSSAWKRETGTGTRSGRPSGCSRLRGFLARLEQRI